MLKVPGPTTPGLYFTSPQPSPKNRRGSSVFKYELLFLNFQCCLFQPQSLSVTNARAVSPPVFGKGRGRLHYPAKPDLISANTA